MPLCCGFLNSFYGSLVWAQNMWNICVAVCTFQVLIQYCLATAEQVLREFNHVNPQDDEEGKVFADTRVSFSSP